MSTLIEICVLAGICIWIISDIASSANIKRTTNDMMAANNRKHGGPL